jgi:aminoethylphosphonate catabolism LysR family transcriptional regulator
MSIAQLRCFHYVAREGSFVAASHALNMTQPSVSIQVKSLEERYGIELLRRLRRGAELTSTGQSLLAITQRLFDNEMEVFEFLEATRGLESGNLRIGAGNPYQVSEMLKVFNERYPKLDVSVWFGNSENLQNDVLSYRTDIAVLGSISHPPDLYSLQFSLPEIVVVVNRNHPLGKRSSIRLKELEGQKFISREEGSETRRAFNHVLLRAGIKPNQVMEIAGREGMLAAVAQGIGVGVVSIEEYVPQESLRVLSISDARIFTEIHVVCLQDRKEGRLISAFLQIAQELVSARQGNT